MQTEFDKSVNCHSNTDSPFDDASNSGRAVQMLTELFHLTGIPDPHHTATDLLAKHQSISSLVHADRLAFMQAGYAHTNLSHLFELLNEIICYQHKELLATRVPIHTTDALKDYALGTQKGMLKEVMSVLFLDGLSQLISQELHFHGGVDYVATNSLEIFRGAVCARARFVALIHNHPTGYVGPSRQDIADTAKLSQQLSFLGLDLIDHIIVASNSAYSFRENNML